MGGFSQSIQSRHQNFTRPVQQINPANKVSAKRHQVKQNLDTDNKRFKSVRPHYGDKQTF